MLSHVSEGSDSSDDLDGMESATELCQSPRGLEASCSTGGPFEAVTLPIPTTGLLTSPPQIAWHSAAYAQTQHPGSSGWSEDVTSAQHAPRPASTTEPTVESRFSLPALFANDAGRSAQAGSTSINMCNSPAQDEDSASSGSAGPFASLHSCKLALAAVEPEATPCAGSDSADSDVSHPPLLALCSSFARFVDTPVSQGGAASMPQAPQPDSESITSSTGVSGYDCRDQLPPASLPVPLEKEPTANLEPLCDGDGMDPLQDVPPGPSAGDNGDDAYGEEGFAADPVQDDTCAGPSDGERIGANRSAEPSVLSAADTGISSADTQAMVSTYTPELQRYIETRAQHYKSLIDESLQRPGASVATPSKGAITALAVLVAMKECEAAIWPYRTPGMSGGGFKSTLARRNSLPSGEGGGMRQLFRSPSRAAVGSGRDGVGDAYSGGPVAFTTAVDGHPSQAPQLAAQAPTGSCTMCFGSVIVDSQGLQMRASAEQMSDARGAARPPPTGRPTSWGSSTATPQPVGGFEPKSGMSSACSNAYGRGPYNPQAQQHGSYAPFSGARRPPPPGPSPRGLGCGLSQPVKPRAGRDRLRPSAGVDFRNLPYLDLGKGAAQGQEQPPGGGLTRRSRVSLKAVDEQQAAAPGLYRQESRYLQYAGKRPPAVHAALQRGERESAAAPVNRGRVPAQASIRPSKGAASIAGLQPLRQGTRGASADREKQRPLADPEQKRRRVPAPSTAAARGTQPKRGSSADVGYAAMQRRQQEGLRAQPDGDNGTDASHMHHAAFGSRDYGVFAGGASYEQLLLRGAGPGGGYQAWAGRNSASPGARRPTNGSGHLHARRRPAGPSAGSRGASTGRSGTGSEADAAGKERARQGMLWEATAQPQMPHPVQGFPGVASNDRHVDKRTEEWRPAFSALSLEQLLAGPSAANAAGAQANGADVAATLARAGSAAPAPPGGGISGELPPMLEHSESAEPATAFVIVSRRNTREVHDAPGAPSSGPASSLVDLSTLLPAPAWVSHRPEPPLGSGGGNGGPLGPAAGPSQPAAAVIAVAERGTQTADLDQPARAHTSRPGAVAGAPPSAPYNPGGKAVRSAGGAPGACWAPAARRAFASAGGAAFAGPGDAGTRCQLGANYAAMKEREQLSALEESPARARYPIRADSPTPPTQQQAQRATSAGAGGARPTAAAARGSQATLVHRPSAAMGLAPTGRLITVGPRSRSAPHTRPRKAVLRPPKPLSQQPKPQAQARPLRQEHSAAPTAPSSPPPPMQSKTPTKFRSEGGVGSSHRWANGANQGGDDCMPCAGSPGGSSPSTPVDRRLPTRAPEDMPLSTAGLRARRALADAMAHPDEDLAAAPLVGPGFGQGLSLMQGAGAHVRVKPRSIPALRGIACAPQQSRGGGTPLPAWKPAASTAAAAAAAVAATAVPRGSAAEGAGSLSPGHQRGVSHQDCTPNILSPPRNYDRPWAAPTRLSGALEEGQGPVVVLRDDRGGEASVANATSGLSRRYPRAADGRSSPRPAQRRGEGTRQPPGSSAANGATALGGGSAGATHQAAALGSSVPQQAPDNVDVDDCCLGASPNSSLQMQLSETVSAQRYQGAPAVDAVSRGRPPRGSREFAPATGDLRHSASSYTGMMLARQQQLQQQQVQQPVQHLNGRVGGQTMNATTAGAVAVDSLSDAAEKTTGSEQALSEPANPAPPGTSSRSTGSMGGGNSSRASVGVPSANSDAPRRTAPAGNGGAQLALVQQAAWPSLHSPRVMDALSTLEAGIAVLEPTPVATPAGWKGASEASVTAMPNGCFALFQRHASAAKAAAAAGHGADAQRPVLMRVAVADGAVDLRFLRPRRNGGGSSSSAGATPPPGEQRVRVAALCGLHPPLPAVAADAGAAVSAGGAAAGTGTTATSSAAVEDDVVDPASRWLQLVMMEGGLLRLSACSPADHARMVLGINAALLVAAGAVGEEAPLASVPLRGLAPGCGSYGKAP